MDGGVANGVGAHSECSNLPSVFFWVVLAREECGGCYANAVDTRWGKERGCKKGLGILNEER